MKNETFEQLMIGGAEVALSDDQRQFVATHRRILACGNMAGQYLVEMAQNLKKMRDGKLYRAAGFAEFRDYVREAIGIEERQAYNYIRVAEGLPKDFLAEHAGLGITKLSILAAAEPEDRAAVIESGEADASVRVLQEKIRELEAERDSRAEQLSMFAAQAEEATRARAAAERELADTETDRRAASEAWEKANAAAEEAKADAEKARGLLKLAEAKVTRLTEEKARAEKEAKDLKNAPPRIEQVDNPETEAKLAAAEADRDAAVAALETAKKQLEIAADDKMTRFSVLFEEFQVTLGKMLALAGEMEDARRAKCIAALQSILRGRGL